MTISMENLLDKGKESLTLTILDLLNINYTIIDKDGNYIAQNSATAKNISKGLENAADIDPIAWEDCLSVMRSKNRAVKTEFDQVNGRYFLSVKQPIVEKDHCVGIVVVSIDITEQKQAEIAKDEFLTNMGHDLRTPFSGILSLTQYLEQTEQDSGRKDLLGDIVSSAERLLKLLNQVLEISSIGSHSLQITDFDIYDIILETKDLMMAEIKHKGLELIISCPNKVISSDRMRLSRIILNLVGNAVKYTDTGKVSIVVTIEPQLKISIVDTGCGIPEESFDMIFKKFSRLESAYKEQSFNGSGIGLHITKEFAKDLGGGILVESELGRGSKFTFYLN